jgi:glyoxylase-like metal-dependent hydrolase (beta-lactamase superfamily II)
MASPLVRSREHTKREHERFPYGDGVQVAEIAPGLWRWTGFHEEWEEEVGSVYCEFEDGVVLVDPLVPPEDAESFWKALDRDVKRAGGEVHVLVTVFWHTRSTAQMVDRYGARVWAPTRGKQAIARRAGVVTDPFRPEDALPGGIRAIATARAAEVVYWLPQHRAVVPGDVLLGEGAKGGGTRHAGPAGLRLCPKSWLPEKTSLAALAESLGPLLELPLERILVSHGEPVLSDARRALSAAFTVE